MIPTLRSWYRMGMTLIVFIIGLPSVIVVDLLKLTRKNAPMASWVTTWMARRLLKIYRIEFECRERERFATHHGFIFPNHLSFLDILGLISLGPVRFLAKSEIADWPFVGRIGKAVGTVWVNRSDDDSREAARQALTELTDYPPIALFPEGGIHASLKLQPFRWGAFEIAIERGFPILPAAYIYPRLDISGWRKEPLKTAMKRLGREKGPTPMRLVGLRDIHPLAGDDPRELALEAHGSISAALIAYSGNADDVIASGL